MKNFTTLLGILLTAISFGQAIDVTSSPWRDVMMRRFGAGDLVWKRAFAPIYEPSTQKSTLFMNINGDFQNGVEIGGLKTAIGGDLIVGNTGLIPTAKFTVAAFTEGQAVPVKAISIVGPNLPLGTNSAQDISWDFNGQSSAKIRSYRGVEWDTYLQIITTPTSGGVPLVRMHIGSEGKVGIGTSTTFPSNPIYANYKLFVTGGILTDEVRVALSSSGTWADYVFAKDYKLLSIKEVEQFIAKNNHLPNVPSAKQVKEEGINVGDMA